MNIAHLREQAKRQIETGQSLFAASGWAENTVTALDEIERLREAQRWIPVSERLPELDPNFHGLSVDVWIAFNGQMAIGFCCQDGSYWQRHGNAAHLPVTHWMPLPESPKEKAA
jgi:hypothetical protein